jgi:hypothetical protein
MDNNKHEFTMNIGLPSIMLIFVVLCLVSFGVLSLVSANADLKLSRKVLTRQAAYYNACNEAEDMLMEVDTKLHEAYRQSSSLSEYNAKISELPTQYVYTISDIQSLRVTLSYLYPDDISKPLYRIEEWREVTSDDIAYDTSLHLIQIDDIN